MGDGTEHVLNSMNSLVNEDLRHWLVIVSVPSFGVGSCLWHFCFRGHFHPLVNVSIVVGLIKEE